MGNKQTPCANEKLCGNDLSLSKFEILKLKAKFCKNRPKICIGNRCSELEPADANFKALLTHPTILEQFRKYCCEMDVDQALDFYLQAKDIRSTLETFLDPSDRVIVFNRILDYQPYPSQTILLTPLNHFAVVDDFKVLVAAMNQLRLAQHEALFHLRYFWRLYLKSTSFTNLLLEKEVRSLISIHKLPTLEDPMGGPTIAIPSPLKLRSQSFPAENDISCDFVLFPTHHDICRSHSLSIDTLATVASFE